MRNSPKKKQNMEYRLLVQHSYYLRSTVNLAYDRFLKFQETIDSAKLSGTLMDDDNLMTVQIKTAKEIGGVKTKMLLDAPIEIHKYHHAPIQISYCLLYAMLEKYKYLIQHYPLFQDEKIDKYFQENNEYIKFLKKLRDSILHERFDNLNEQKKFLTQFYNCDKDCLMLLMEGQQLFDDLLTRIWNEIKDNKELIDE